MNLHIVSMCSFSYMRHARNNANESRWLMKWTGVWLNVASFTYAKQWTEAHKQQNPIRPIKWCLYLWEIFSENKKRNIFYCMCVVLWPLRLRCACKSLSWAFDVKDITYLLCFVTLLLQLNECCQTVSSIYWNN